MYCRDILYASPTVHDALLSLDGTGNGRVPLHRALDIGIGAVCCGQTSHQGNDKSVEETHVRSSSVGRKAQCRNARMA